jgi:RNA polymerase sigma-70 factor (ECF subfamily)
VYWFLRGSGNSPESAQDLVQAFFVQLLDKGWLTGLSPERGRFRAFLLVAARNFLANERDRASARKRGLGLTVSRDWDLAERNYRLEAPVGQSPERIYEKKWARTAVDGAVEELRQEFARAGRAVVFEALREWLTGDGGGVSYAEAAEDLGMSETAVKTAVHRMRRRFGHILRRRIAETLDDPSQVDDEVRHLLRVLGS